MKKKNKKIIAAVISAVILVIGIVSVIILYDGNEAGPPDHETLLEGLDGGYVLSVNGENFIPPYSLRTLLDAGATIPDDVKTNIENETSNQYRDVTLTFSNGATAKTSFFVFQKDEETKGLDSVGLMKLIMTAEDVKKTPVYINGARLGKTTGHEIVKLFGTGYYEIEQRGSEENDYNRLFYQSDMYDLKMFFENDVLDRIELSYLRSIPINSDDYDVQIIRSEMDEDEEYYQYEYLCNSSAGLIYLDAITEDGSYHYYLHLPDENQKVYKALDKEPFEPYDKVETVVDLGYSPDIFCGLYFSNVEIPVYIDGEWVDELYYPF